MITASYFNSLSDDQLIQKSTTDDLVFELSTIVKSEIRNTNLVIGSDELEAILNRVDTDIRIGVANGICEVTISRGEIIDASFERIDSELKSSANEAVDKYSGDIGNKVLKRLDRMMATIPCGLPVMPPHWTFTVNMWTYEVIGRYEEFTVVDNDNEVIPKPYFRHKGQKYVRNEDHIRHPCKVGNDGSSIWLGNNKRITFHLIGCSATVVGSGPKGVGDKTGDRTEKSIGYDDLLIEFRG